MIQDFTYNGSNYRLFPFDENTGFNFNKNTGVLTVFENDVVGSCTPEHPLFAWQKQDFTDEEILIGFAGNTDKTITEILSELEIDVSEINDFLIVQTI